MDFICLNCGHINFEATDFTCTDCSLTTDEERYKFLESYSLSAVQFGYEYRANYEEQVKEENRLHSKYFFPDPITAFVWLALAVLGGIAGNLATDMVKYVAKQIGSWLSSKQNTQELSLEEMKVKELINDPVALQKFMHYVGNYYIGMPGINKIVLAGILEEEMAHAATDANNYDEEFSKTLSDKNPNEAMYDLLMKAAKEARLKRLNKPKPDELKDTFKKLKQEIKNEKKRKKKGR